MMMRMSMLPAATSASRKCCLSVHLHSHRLTIASSPVTTDRIIVIVATIIVASIVIVVVAVAATAVVVGTIVDRRLFVVAAIFTFDNR